MKAEEILERLKDVVEVPAGGWLAECPAHPDKYRSLYVYRGNGGALGPRIVFRCNAGCSQTAVLDAIGLVVRDLYEELGPKKTEDGMITGREIGPAGLAEVTETVPEVKELPEVVPESERLPEATMVETLELTAGGETVARIREAVPAETEGLTAAEIQERMELTAADVNWKAREAERRKLLEAGAKAGMDHKVAMVLRDTNENKSEMQRKRRLRKARLARRIQGWLIGCWPETDEDARVGCGRCEYRAKKDGDGSGDDVAENELAGCEGVEEVMVPLAMLEDLRELLKLVRENLI